MNLIKLISLCAIATCLVSACTKNDMYCNMQNPWVDCGTDMICAQKKSGLKFSPIGTKYDIRAMKDMIEVRYYDDEKGKITVRKAKITEFGDISGDYTQYPIRGDFEYNNIVFCYQAFEENKIRVVNFEDFRHDYSIACEKGLTKDEVINIYEIIKKIEK